VLDRREGPIIGWVVDGDDVPVGEEELPEDRIIRFTDFAVLLGRHQGGMKGGWILHLLRT